MDGDGAGEAGDRTHLTGTEPAIPGLQDVCGLFHYTTSASKKNGRNAQTMSKLYPSNNDELTVNLLKTNISLGINPGKTQLSFCYGRSEPSLYTQWESEKSEKYLFLSKDKNFLSA